MDHIDHDRERGREVREKLNHPIIDADGHAVELRLALPDFLKQVAGADEIKKWESQIGAPTVLQTPPGGWYLSPSGPITIDRAMAMLPDFRKAQHEQAGIDFAIIYTTLGLQMLNIREDDRRRAFCRALNMMSADMYASHKDTMTPSAIIPIETPQEALDELEFSVKTLGLKTITINGSVTRQPTKEEPRRIIPLALDGEYDYDPFWKRCVELGVSVACHGGSSGSDRHASRVNYTFNHIGTFATHGEFFCRSLFFGGVSRRFPTLNFAFLEGGVGWACSLYNSIFEHWEKRNRHAMAEYLDPRTLDVELLVEMSKKYPNAHVTPERVREEFSEIRSKLSKDSPVPDDFAACRIESGQDIRDLFTKTFYFGCEADDRMAAVAFDQRINHYGATFKAVFSSDIGHWDVQNALAVLNEAYEMRVDGLMDERQFEDFTFANSVRLHGGMNPDFFKGTVVEDQAARILAGDKKARTAK